MSQSTQTPPNALLLAELRQRIRHLETPQPWLSDEGEGHDTHIGLSSCPLNILEIDSFLPGGGLFRGALHEIVSGTNNGFGAKYVGATASGFAAFLAAQFAGTHGHILWCRRDGTKESHSRGRYGPNIYGPGLAALGLDPRRLIMVRGLNREEILWAMEEGLTSRALCAVIGEPGHIDQTASRRLQLAAEGSLTPALLLMSEHALPAASPAHTRWRINTLRTRVSHHTFPASAPHWLVELLKCRGTQPHEWTITRKNPDVSFGMEQSTEHVTDNSAELSLKKTHHFVVVDGLFRGSRSAQPATTLTPFRRIA